MKDGKRFVDNQGRFVIPYKIREVLGVKSGDTVDFHLMDDGTVRISFGKTRCSLCCKGIEEGATAYKISAEHTICEKCVKTILKAYDAQRGAADNGSHHPERS